MANLERVSNILFNLGVGVSGGAFFFKTFFYTGNNQATYFLIIALNLLVDPGEKAILFDKFKGLQDKVIGEGCYQLKNVN